MPHKGTEDIGIFTQDIRQHGGYLYTTNSPLSSRLAHKRISDAIASAVDFRGKRVIDIGCGDGTFTIELFDRLSPLFIEGIDLAGEALFLAQQRSVDRRISFSVASAYDLPYPTGSFDVAHVRAVLHHMDDPLTALREALRVASVVVVAEPNGNNPGVKMFERFSRYHREHKEKSYSSFQLNRWIKQAKGEIIYNKWIGLVPTFCPNWAANLAKFLEPVVEHTPVLNMVGCSIYIIVAR